MKYHLEWPTELQAVERKFLLKIEDLEKEFIYKKHTPTFYRIIKKRDISKRGTEYNRRQSNNYT
jgi:hypothetical protein